MSRGSFLSAYSCSLSSEAFAQQILCLRFSEGGSICGSGFFCVPCDLLRLFRSFCLPFAALRLCVRFYQLLGMAAVGLGVRAEKVLDLRACRDASLAAGLSGFQAGSGGGKTDTLVEGSSLD